MIPADSKPCAVCNTIKSFEEFYKNPTGRYGRSQKCIECTKEYWKQHRLANAERLRVYDKVRWESPPERKAAHDRYVAESNERFPKRKKARDIVSNAIRDGKLIPLPCLICGDKGEAHHPNYDAPLDVMWLCKLHHTEVHSIAREFA